MTVGAEEWGEELGYDLETILETLGLEEEESLIASPKQLRSGKSPRLLAADSLSKLELAPPVPDDDGEALPLTEQQKKNLARREHIVREMHETEKSYTESLQTAIMLFLLPLRRLQKQPNAPASGEEVERIFSNIEQLVTINSRLLKQMSVRLASWSDQSQWADLMLAALVEPEFLAAYQEYISNYPRGVETVTTLSSSKGSKFSQFVDRALVNDLCQNQGSLNTFLITPVQRLPRYILFLKDLQSCTDAKHPDAANIATALTNLKELTGKIHAAQDMYEHVSHVESLYNRFGSEDSAKVRRSNEPSRVLIKEGPMLQMAGAKYHVLYCILFSDCLVGATKARKGRLKLKWIINLNHCSLSETSDPESGADFILCTQQKLEEFPFTVQTEMVMTGIAGSQYDAQSWLTAFKSSCLTRHDNRAALARAAHATRQVLEAKLFPQADWDKLLLGAKSQLYQTDDVVYDGREDSEWMVVVLSGRLQVQFASLTLDSIGVNQFVGASPLAKISPTQWKAIAVEPTSVARVQISKAESLLASDSRLSGRFMHLLALVFATRNLNSHLESAAAVPQRSTSRRIATETDRAQQKPKKTRNDKAADKLLAKLGLPNETLVDSFPAKLKKSMFNFGTLMVMKENVAFVSKTFGHFTRIVLPGRCICEVVARDSFTIFVNHLRAGEPPLELVFKTAELKDRAYPLLTSFLNSKKVQHNLSVSTETRSSLALSGSEREELLSHAISLDYKAGATILAQGEMCQYVYQLVEGDCVVQGLVEGKLETFGRIEKDELFGEISFIAGTVSSANVVADTDVTVLAFDRAKLESSFNDSPGCATGFYRSIARLLYKRIAGNS